MSELLSLVQENGVLGLVCGLFVLLTVYGLNYFGVVVTKGQKQSANVVLSILIAGLSLLNPENAEVIVAAIASVGSALMYEFIRFVGKQYEARKATAK
jgi:hypothetical protein